MLSIKDVRFAYDKTPVLNKISFNLNLGEHLSIIGESGSGKSTLLKLIYGEYDLDEGEILWNNSAVLGPKYNLVIGYDFMKYVAQEFDLMPFISVEENIGKYLSNFYPEEKKERINELMKVVELSDFSSVKVKNLSGGQKQRVALARALANEPEIILLDEPFSHIDNFKKQSLRRKLFDYLKTNNITCIVATHDKDDVLGYADRMIVLNDSTILVNNTPEELYKNPETSLIASFFGEFSVINNVIVYAHQLAMVEHSDLKVIVKKSYFKGTHFLIEAAVLNGEIIFFQHDFNLKEHQIIYLEITK